MKVMKRAMMGAVATVLAVGGAQASGFLTLNETFESYTVGDPLPNPPWVGVGGTGVTGTDYSVVLGYGANTTQVLKITDLTSVNGVELQNLDPVTGGIFYLDFDLAHDGGQQVSKLYFRDASDRNVVQMWMWPEGNTSGFPMLNLNNSAPIINVMTAGQWYHVRLALDLDANTIAAEVDGLTQASGVSVGDYPLEKIGFTTYAASSFGAGASYWDNLVGTPEPASALLLMAGTVSLLRRRRA